MPSWGTEVSLGPRSVTLARDRGPFDKVAGRSGIEPAYEGPQVTVPPRRRRLSAERRQALELLANSQSGLTEVLLFANGVTPHMLGRLLRSGLATVQREAIKSGDQTIELGRVTITDAGRRVLETLHRPDAQ
jgi:hypothetical protein